MGRKWSKWEWAEMLFFAGPATAVVFLLVAATAISVLSSMFSGHHGTRENALRASCQSNLKQIALALAQYAADNEKFPPANNSTSDFVKTDNWVGRISPYTKSAQVFQCPSDENATDEQKTSYGFNARLAAAEPKIRNAKSVILNYEAQADGNNWTQTGTGPQAVSASERHRDGANYSFADGHVKWLKPTQVMAKKTDGKNFTFHPQ